MPLDPGVKAMLDLLASFNAPALSAGTPEQARAGMRMMAVDARPADSIIAVGAVEDVKFDGPAGTIAVRIYRPAGFDGSSPVPTVVFFHGGGFVIGDIDTHDNQCRRICRDVAAVVASIDYRLAPESPWPAAADDCFAATAWAAASIDSLGGDPARLAVAGDSAGGNLAAVVAQMCRDNGGPLLAAQLLIYPAVDFTSDTGSVYPSRADNAEGYFLTAADMFWFAENYVADADISDPKLSPIRGRLAGLPPAVVATAEYDPLRDEGEAYAAALSAAGVAVTARRYDGLVHGFFDMGSMSPACERAAEEVCADFAALL